jgi:hypothetical protein
MIPSASDELSLVNNPEARARCQAFREVVEKLDKLIAEQRNVAQLPYVRSSRPRAETLLGDLQAACAEEKLKGLIEAAEAAMSMYRAAVDEARGETQANGAEHDQARRDQVEQLPTV